MNARGFPKTETLLKVVLVLVIVWIATELVFEVLTFAFGPFLQPLLGIVIIALIVMYFLD